MTIFSNPDIKIRVSFEKIFLLYFLIVIWYLKIKNEIFI